MPRSIPIPEPIRTLAGALGVPAAALLKGYAQAAWTLGDGVRLDELDALTARRVGAVVHAFRDLKRAVRAARAVLKEAGIKADYGTLLTYIAVGWALERRRFARARRQPEETPKRPRKRVRRRPRRERL